MKNKKVLTAREGADRVADRFKRKSKKGVSANAEVKFPNTCENCGGHDFSYTRSGYHRSTCEKYLPCVCGGSESGIAAIISLTEFHSSSFGGHITDNLTDPMDEGWESSDCEGKNESKEQIFCKVCFFNDDDTPPGKDNWKPSVRFSPDGVEVEPLTEHIKVFCDKCGHEIEFGWSLPNQKGCICPVESKAFHPFECWPEPRFEADWRRRGWLRPSETEIAKQQMLQKLQPYMVLMN